MKEDPFKEYLKESEPTKKEFDYKSIITTDEFIWHIAKFIANPWQIQAHQNLLKHYVKWI